MARSANVCVALLLACTACGGEDSVTEERDAQSPPSDAGPAPVMPSANDANVGGSTPDAGGSSTPEASLPEADTGAPGGPADASGAGKDATARPPLVLETPKSTVPCAGSPCDTLENVCCESWSKGTGFGTTQSCVTRKACDDKYERSGEMNRSIPHECDGKEDCSGGQVCCMIAYSQPLCEFADIAMCITKLTGPGGSGMCVDNDKCTLGATQFVAEGVPLGILACNDDSDCADRAETKCQPEQSDSLTTGKGVKARSYVKVCR